MHLMDNSSPNPGNSRSLPFHQRSLGARNIETETSARRSILLLHKWMHLLDTTAKIKTVSVQNAQLPSFVGDTGLPFPWSLHELKKDLEAKKIRPKLIPPHLGYPIAYNLTPPKQRPPTTLPALPLARVYAPLSSVCAQHQKTVVATTKHEAPLRKMEKTFVMCGRQLPLLDFCFLERKPQQNMNSRIASPSPNRLARSRHLLPSAMNSRGKNTSTPIMVAAGDGCSEQVRDHMGDGAEPVKAIFMTEDTEYCLEARSRRSSTLPVLTVGQTPEKAKKLIDHVAHAIALAKRGGLRATQKAALCAMVDKLIREEMFCESSGEFQRLPMDPWFVTCWDEKRRSSKGVCREDSVVEMVKFLQRGRVKVLSTPLPEHYQQHCFTPRTRRFSRTMSKNIADVHSEHKHVVQLIKRRLRAISKAAPTEIRCAVVHRKRKRERESHMLITAASILRDYLQKWHRVGRLRCVEDLMLLHPSSCAKRLKDMTYFL